MENKRSAIRFRDLTLFMDMIYSIIPDKNILLIKDHEYYYEISDPDPIIPNGSLIQVTLTDGELREIKFEFIKYIKTLPDPEDRVADFEYRDINNLPDFEKMDRLIEKRKTREEKSKEFNEELSIKESCEKHGIEYHGTLKDL